MLCLENIPAQGPFQTTSPVAATCSKQLVFSHLLGKYSQQSLSHMCIHRQRHQVNSHVSNICTINTLDNDIHTTHMYTGTGTMCLQVPASLGHNHNHKAPLATLIATLLTHQTHYNHFVPEPSTCRHCRGHLGPSLACGKP